MTGVIRFVAIVVAALAMTAGCSTAPSPPAPEPRPAVTQRELCDSLLAFFGNELHAVGLQARPNIDMNSTLSVGGICTSLDSESQRANGTIILRNAPNVPDPTEGVRGFTKTTEQNETVWLQDMRVDASNPGVEVVLATRIGEWNGQLRITDSQTRTAGGVLHLTDEGIRKAAQYLIELTRKLSKT